MEKLKRKLLSKGQKYKDFKIVEEESKKILKRLRSLGRRKKNSQAVSMSYYVVLDGIKYYLSDNQEDIQAVEAWFLDNLAEI